MSHLWACSEDPLKAISLPLKRSHSEMSGSGAALSSAASPTSPTSPSSSSSSSSSSVRSASSPPRAMSNGSREGDVTQQLKSNTLNSPVTSPMQMSTSSSHLSSYGPAPSKRAHLCRSSDSNPQLNSSTSHQHHAAGMQEDLQGRSVLIGSAAAKIGVGSGSLSPTSSSSPVNSPKRGGVSPFLRNSRDSTSPLSSFPQSSSSSSSTSTSSSNDVVMKDRESGMDKGGRQRKESDPIQIEAGYTSPQSCHSPPYSTSPSSSRSRHSDIPDPDWAKVVLAGEDDPAAEYRTIRRVTADKVARENVAECYLSAFLNSKKNRYMDVLPYEHTRVRLAGCSEGGGDGDCYPGNDYINASMLKGLLGYRYIATQAPLPSTVGDFWEMVWEQKSLTVVMLTRIVEASKTKAIRYWPSQIGETLSFSNQVAITLMSEKLHPCKHICVRMIQLRQATETRIITHLHYTEWPDYGLPTSTEGLRILVHLTDALTREQLDKKKLNKLLQNSSAESLSLLSSHNSAALPPIVVHCSAGIGRAGTFIAIHQTVKQIQAKIEHDLHGVSSTPDLEEVRSIMDIVLSMREQRRGMVQTKEQYSFIYRVSRDALNNLLLGGVRTQNNPLRQSWSSEGKAAALFLQQDCAPEMAESVFLRKTNASIPLSSSSEDGSYETPIIGSDSDGGGPSDRAANRKKEKDSNASHYKAIFEGMPELNDVKSTAPSKAKKGPDEEMDYIDDSR